MREESYEDQFSRPARWRHRLRRFLAWRLKSILGMPRLILVELRWRLGDEIMALPVFESLRKHFPADHIAVLSNYPDLFINHPFVDSVNQAPNKIDRYILLRGAPRSRYRLEHYTKRAKVSLPVWRPHLYYPHWECALLSALPQGEGPLIALAAGSTWPTKQWPVERWRSLGESLQAQGCRIIELGKDHPPAGVGTNLIDQSSIAEAACLLHHADLLIACDCGLMHLALAVTTPVVALFGPTDPNILIRQEANFHPLCSSAPCQGYWNRPGPEPDPLHCPEGHASCLESITVEEVLDEVAKHIAFPRRGC